MHAFEQFPRKEANILFKDVFNTFYLRLYGVGHTVMGHSDNMRGIPLIFLIRVLSYEPIDREIVYITAIVTIMGSPRGVDPTSHRTMSGRSTTELSSLPLMISKDLYMISAAAVVVVVAAVAFIIIINFFFFTD